MDVHREYAFSPHSKCVGCGGRPHMRAIVMAPFDEVQKRGMLPAGAIASPGLMQSIVPIKNSEGNPDPYVRISVTHSCTMCSRAFQTALAKLPSWCIVEINEGPKAEAIITSN